MSQSFAEFCKVIFSFLKTLLVDLFCRGQKRTKGEVPALVGSNKTRSGHSSCCLFHLLQFLFSPRNACACTPRGCLEREVSFILQEV